MHNGVERAYFFVNGAATTEIYTLSLHDALPISCARRRSTRSTRSRTASVSPACSRARPRSRRRWRSEEHTSELQSRLHLVCRLLLEKKKILYGLSHARWWARSGARGHRALLAVV